MLTIIAIFAWMLWAGVVTYEVRQHQQLLEVLYAEVFDVSDSDDVADESN